jgi:hypothetical protein
MKNENLGSTISIMCCRVIAWGMVLMIACVPAATLSAEQDLEQATEDAIEQAATQAAEKVVEKTTAEVAEKAAEKAVEKVAADAAAEDELKAQRPDEWKGPTKVDFFVFVLDIDEIDDASQNFTANVWIRLRWKDQRLANLGGERRQKRLEEIWNPQVLLANRQGLVSKSLPDVVVIDPDGTVFYDQRYTGHLSQPLMLSEFPFDKHIFTIHFVAAGYTTDEVTFVPGVGKVNPSFIGGQMARTWSLQDWERVQFEALPLFYEPLEGLKVPGFAARFEAKRYIAYYIWQIVLPLAVVVVMSWAAFWIGRVHVGVRIGVATSSILTLIAQRFVFASLLPRLPYMTRLDYFTVGSTLLVFMALLVVVMTSYLSTIDRDPPARVVDLSARVAFPVVFLLLLGWFFFG